MKRYIQSLAVVALMAAAAGFASCQQEDSAITHALTYNQTDLRESTSDTRSDDSPLCSIKTDTLGQVESKLKAYAEENSTDVTALFKISIEGPINQTDIDYLKSLPYVDSLSLEKSLFHDTDGKQTGRLPERCFMQFKSAAAVVIPEHITVMAPSCFYEAKIRAIYMDKVQIMEEKKDESLHRYNIDSSIMDEDGYSSLSHFGGQFRSCTNLKVAKLSDKLAYIPAFAFYNCTSLGQITLPSSLTEMGRAAFAWDALKEVTLPPNLVTLGGQTFRNCSSLTKVNMNKVLKSMGGGEFKRCSKLESFTFPDNLLDMGQNVLSDDPNLTEVKWPSSIKTIPQYTFSGCEKLKFTIPDYITAIDSYAFWGCKAITEMTIPASVESFGDYIFACSGLSSFVNGMDWIPNHFYQGCEGFTEVTIPESMTSVGTGAFQDCPNITSLTIKGGAIGSEAFRNCQKLKTVTIEKCEYIGDYTFYENQAMKQVSILECGDIGSGAFENCDALSDLHVAKCSTIYSYAFRYCDAFKQLTIDKCTVIGHKAFDSCQGLQEVNIGECKGLDNDAFYQCHALKKFGIGKMDEGYICPWSFYQCYKLTEVNLPEGLVTINSIAFYEATALEHITIPSTVEKAEDDIFRDCPNLKYVDWKSTKTTIPYLNMSNNNPNLLVFAPAGASSHSGNPIVIIDGKAARVNIQQGKFYTPRSFTADEVVLTIDFGADRWKNTHTGTDVAARWNTIAVPFTVTSIKSANKGALAPFGSDDANDGNAKPFWLCELTSEGFKDATTIEANKPYILAMPNNPNYVDEYNIQDVVTFTGTNATFAASSEQQASSPTGPAGWALTPLYRDSSDAQLMAMNWEAFTDNKNIWHPVGNCFRLNVRTANAFEAVITATSASAAAVRNGYIPLGSGTTRSSHKLGRIPQREDMPMP